MAMILTLRPDAPSFARLEPLRQAHFPASRNFIPVHVTLFQQLPPEALPRILTTLAGVAGRTAPLPFTAAKVLDFGKGAAIGLDMPGFDALHRTLARAWADVLTDSDTRRRKPHVTVQNKVSRDRAVRTLDALRAGFAPWDGTADALDLWRYRGGPWEAVSHVPLGVSAS